MKRHLLTMLAALSLALFSGGCYKYVPVEVTAISGITGEPVEGVHIDPSYNRFLEFFPPRMVPGVTGVDGKAVMRIAVNYKSGHAGLYLRDRVPDPAEPSRIESEYVLDQPELASSIDLPVAEYRAKRESLGRKALEAEPFRVTLRLLTLEEWRHIYQNEPNSGRHGVRNDSPVCQQRGSRGTGGSRGWREAGLAGPSGARSTPPLAGGPVTLSRRHRRSR